MWDAAESRHSGKERIDARGIHLEWFRRNCNSVRHSCYNSLSAWEHGVPVVSGSEMLAAVGVGSTGGAAAIGSGSGGLGAVVWRNAFLCPRMAGREYTTSVRLEGLSNLGVPGGMLEGCNPLYLPRLSE
jgi:hypothetical protein